MARIVDPSQQARPVPRLVGGVAQLHPAGPLEGEGRGLQALGADVERGTDEIFASMKIEEEKVNTTRVEDAWNQYKSKALDLTMGEAGLFKLKGGEAVNGNILQKLTASLKDTGRAIESSLANDEQKERFRQRAQVTDLQAKHQALTHLDKEFRAYQKSTMEGSEAAARAQVAAAPTNPGAFALAQDTIMRQADVYLQNEGITDKGAIDAYKARLNDGLWVSRIEALLYEQPILAEAIFRANQGEIKDPHTRLLLQAKTREVALAVSAGVEAQKVVDEVRQRAAPAELTPVTGTGPRSMRNNNPGNIEKSSFRWQGEVEGADPRFATFATYEDGLRAMQQNLLTYQDKHGLRTVEGIINRWAPAKENGQEATAAYVKNVAAALGVKPDEKIDLRDPTTLQAMTAAMTVVEAGGSGSLRKVSSAPQDPLTANTNGLPTSRDIAAQLPLMMLRVERRATDLYGSDIANPDRAAFVKRMSAEIHAKVAEDVQQLNTIQRQAQGVLIDAVAGLAAQGGMMPTGGEGRAGMPAKPITSFSQIQADPKLMRAWQMMDPQAKLNIERLIEKNLKQDTAGDVTLYRSLFKRIHLPPGDPQKIDFYQQVTDPDIVDRLSTDQINHLYTEIKRFTSPGGRNAEQMIKYADAKAEMYFRTHIMFTAQQNRQIAATMRWNEDVGKKIDEYVAAKKDVRTLFMQDTPDSVINPKYLETYINSTPAQGLAEQSAAVKAARSAGTEIPQPKTQAEYDALPADTIWIDEKGNHRRKMEATPGSAPQTSVQQPTQAQQPAVTMTETGKIATPAPQPASTQEPDIGDIKIFEPRTVAEAAAAKGKKMTATREREAQLLEIMRGRVGFWEGLAQFTPYYTAYKGFIEGTQKAGAEIAQMLPVDRDSTLNAWADIKRTRVVSQYDAPLIERALEYGLPTTDEKLARQILKKLEGKR